MAAGLIVRVVYTLVVGPRISFRGDPRTYHELARQLAAGRGYLRVGVPGLGDVMTAEFPPAFPVLLAALDLLGLASVTAHKLAMCVVGAGTVAATGVLGRRVGGPTAGLVAAGLAAGHPMLFQPEAALQVETLYVLLVVVALMLAYRALEGDRPGRWAALGAVLGLAALTRSEAVLLAGLLLPFSLVPRGGLGFTRRAATLALAVVSMAAVLAPWTIRNAMVVHHFVPLSSNGGTLLGGANCDGTYNGFQKGLWLLSCVDVIDVRGLDETSRNSRFAAVGLEYAREHGSRLPSVMWVRLLRTWGLFDRRGQLSWEFLEGRVRGWQMAGQVFTFALVALSVGGAVVARRRVRLWPLAAVLVAVCVSSALTYGNARFRIAAEPVLAVLAATGLVQVVDSKWGARLYPGRADGG